jgi:hypothetical protein
MGAAMRDRARCRANCRDRAADRGLDRTAGPALDRERISVSIVFGKSAHATTNGRGAKVHPPNRQFVDSVHSTTEDGTAKVVPSEGTEFRSRRARWTERSEEIDSAAAHQSPRVRGSSLLEGSGHLPLCRTSRQIRPNFFVASVVSMFAGGRLTAVYAPKRGSGDQSFCNSEVADLQ